MNWIKTGTLLELLWRWKKRLIAVWLVFIVLTVVRLLLMDNIYTSDCTLVLLPPERVATQAQMTGAGGGVLGQLIGSFGGASDIYASIAFLKSRPILDAVIERFDLKPSLFPRKWDAAKAAWKKSEEPSDWRARLALAKRVDVGFDDYTGLVTLVVHWPDGQKARDIADGFLEISNSMLRQQAIEEGQRRVEELYKESDAAAAAEVSALLADEITRSVSRLASIRARIDYAFRVVDPPIVPEKKSWPPRTLILLAVGFIVGLIEIGIVAGVYLRDRADSAAGSA